MKPYPEERKVEQAAARAALSRMRTSGRARRYGDRRGAFYVLVNRRKKGRAA